MCAEKSRIFIYKYAKPQTLICLEEKKLKEAVEMILFGPLILFKNENRHNAFLPCSCWGQVFPFWHSHLWGWVMGDVHFLLYTFIFKIFYNAHALFKNKSFKGLNKYQNHESYSSVRCKTDEVKSANKHGLLSIKVVSVQSSSGHRGWP